MVCGLPDHQRCAPIVLVVPLSPFKCRRSASIGARGRLLAAYRTSQWLHMQHAYQHAMRLVAPGPPLPPCRRQLPAAAAGAVRRGLVHQPHRHYCCCGMWRHAAAVLPHPPGRAQRRVGPLCLPGLSWAGLGWLEGRCIPSRVVCCTFGGQLACCTFQARPWSPILSVAQCHPHRVPPSVTHTPAPGSHCLLHAAVSSMCVWGLLVVVGIIVFRSAQIVHSPGAVRT